MGFTERELAERLAEMAGLVHSALERATAGLTEPGTTVAAQLTAADRALHQLLDELESCADAMADVTDLRLVAAGVHLGNELETLAGLIQQIAGVAWARHDKGTLPAELCDPLRAIAGPALTLLARAVLALRTATPADLSAELAELRAEQRALYRTPGTGWDPADLAEATLLGCRLRQSAVCAVELAAGADLLG